MQKKVLVTGNFNILHPGHLRMLRFAKERAEKLVVAIWSDRIAGSNALITESIRLEVLLSNNYVDEVFIWDSSIGELIENVKPDIIVKGKEHESRDNNELEFLNKYGGKLIFSSGETTFSSVNILRKEFLAFNPLTINLPEEYMRRHSITNKSVSAILNNFKKLNVIVIGDLIVDEYITCEALGMSQEDPTIVVTPVHKIQFIGGAAITASHAAGLGAKVSYLGVGGKDACADYAVDALKTNGVSTFVISDDARPTTLKQRYRASNKTLLRVSHLQQNAISRNIQDELFARVSELLNECNLLVFSDYNYGCLPLELINKIKQSCIEKSVLMAADCQSSSQIGDISKYADVSLVTPTEHEARLSTKNNGSLMILANELADKMNCPNIVITMGGEGALIHAPRGNDWHTDQIPALNSSPKDTAGAGDSLLITTALALAAGADIWRAVLMGSISASIQVGRLGNSPITTEDFLKEI